MSVSLCFAEQQRNEWQGKVLFNSRIIFIILLVMSSYASIVLGNSNIIVYNSEQCEDKCLRTNGCTKFTISRIDGNSTQFYCHLLPLSGKSLSLRSKLIQSCANGEGRPICQNGGDCIVDAHSCKRFRCMCKNNWQGELCGGFRGVF